jgi:hypothetical protein
MCVVYAEDEGNVMVSDKEEVGENLAVRIFKIHSFRILFALYLLISTTVYQQMWDTMHITGVRKKSNA